MQTIFSTIKEDGVWHQTVETLKLYNSEQFRHHHETVQCRYIVYMRSQDETGQYINLSVIANIIQLLQISLNNLVISSLIQIYH